MTAGSSGCRSVSSSWICRVWPILAAQRIPAALLGHRRAAGRRGQPPRRGHAAHRQQVIADPAVRAADLGHAQVHIGREPDVELGLAGEWPAGQAGNGPAVGQIPAAPDCGAL